MNITDKLDDFDAINTENDLYEAACYRDNSKIKHALISPYMILKKGKDTFVPTFKKQYNELIQKKNTFKKDHYNLMFTAFEKVIEHFYDKDIEWRNKVFNYYKELGYRFPVKCEEDGNIVFLKLEEIENEEMKKDIILNKVKGNFKEHVDNFQFFHKIKNESIFPFLRKLNPQIDFDSAILFVIKETKDAGTDAIIILFKDGKSVGSFSIQYKFRRRNNKFKLSIFEQAGCLAKMINCLQTTKLGVALGIDNEGWRHRFIVTMNDDYQELITEHSRIIYEAQDTPGALKTTLFDRKYIEKNLYSNKIDETVINTIFDYMERINNYALTH